MLRRWLLAVVHFFYLGMVVPSCGGGGSSDEEQAVTRLGESLDERVGIAWLSSPTLSADGTKGAYISEASGSPAVFGFEAAIGAASATARKVADVPASGLVVSQVVLSPDGQRLVLVATDGANSHRLYEVDWTSGQSNEVQGLGSGSAGAVLFSSDSSIGVIVMENGDEKRSFVLKLNDTFTAYPFTPEGEREAALGIVPLADGLRVLTAWSPNRHGYQVLTRDFSSADLLTSSAISTKATAHLTTDRATIGFVEGKADKSESSNIRPTLLSGHLVAVENVAEEQKTLAGNATTIQTANETVAVVHQLAATALADGSASSTIAYPGHEILGIVGSPGASALGVMSREVRRCKDAAGADGLWVYGSAIGLWNPQTGVTAQVFMSLTTVNGAAVVGSVSSVCDSGYDDGLVDFTVNGSATEEQFRVAGISVSSFGHVFWVFDRVSGQSTVFRL